MSKDKSKVKEQEVAGTPQVVVISDDELLEELAERSARGKWMITINAVKEDKKPRKVSGLSRGQIAAVYRAASGSGLGVKCSYRKGEVIVYPLP